MNKQNNTVGSYAPDFELPGVDGTVHHLARCLEKMKAVAVVFMSNNCPNTLSYIEKLKQIQADFAQQGFTLIGINANDATQASEESFEQMKTFAAEKNLNFPYLRDTTQDVANGFKVGATPEAFLIDKEYVLRYRGSIDDMPESPDSANNNYLRDSIEALLKGESIGTDFTEAVGSPIVWRKN
jgi:peroxiredoxin